MKANRDLSERIFSDLSTGTIPLSDNTWMNGSITPPGGVDGSGEDQQRSKSPEVMILPSTKILCMVRRPSSTSAGGVLPTALCPLPEAAGALASAGASAAIASTGKLF